MFIFKGHLAECAIHHVVDERCKADDRDQQRGEEQALPDRRCAITSAKRVAKSLILGIVIICVHGYLLVPFPEAIHHPLTDQVENEGEQEQHQRDREETGVINAVVGKIAAADAGDMSCHGFGCI